MRSITILFLLIGVALLLFPTAASSGNGYGWMADDDGDGIPNGDDPDWIAPEDGSGYQRQNNGKPSFMSFIIELLDGDSERLQQQFKDGRCGDCPDTCHVP